MVSIKAHGGGCCGARHLSGFSGTEDARPDLISTAQLNVEEGRMTEVILNGTQVGAQRNSLRRLADMGYVLVGHYINNNHGSHNYVFHRCDRRLPLLNDRGECVIPNWTGPVITPGLTGNLARPTSRAGGVDTPEFNRSYVRSALCLPAAPGAPPPRPVVNAGAIVRGSRVRVESPTSARHRREFTVLEIRTRMRFDRPRTQVAVMEDDDGRFEIALQNVRLIGPAAAPALPPAPAEPRIGGRVVWNGLDGTSGIRGSVRPRGSLGTITRNTMGANRWFIEWDNPDDNHRPNTVYISRNQFTTLTADEAAANPRFVPPAAEAAAEYPATRHPEAPDFAALRDAARVVAAVPAVVRVFQTFHNVYRDGRRGAGYDTLEAARAQRAEGRVDRREIMSDGTVNWVERAA